VGKKTKKALIGLEPVLSEHENDGDDSDLCVGFDNNNDPDDDDDNDEVDGRDLLSARAASRKRKTDVRPEGGNHYERQMVRIAQEGNKATTLLAESFSRYLNPVQASVRAPVSESAPNQMLTECQSVMAMVEMGVFNEEEKQIEMNKIKAKYGAGVSMENTTAPSARGGTSQIPAPHQPATARGAATQIPASRHPVTSAPPMAMPQPPHNANSTATGLLP
jgi:hypothetical protein